MKYALVLLIFCAGCTLKRDSAKSASTPVPATASANQVPTNSGVRSTPKALPTPTPKTPAEKELQKITKWFEQMDSILRESLFVVRKDRPSSGRSIFGKMQRALIVEMKEKLPNKALFFKCDVYSMSRDVSGLAGYPQKAIVYHKCNNRENFVKIGDWDHPNANELTVNFQGGNLGEVLGDTTGILSPQINCHLKASDVGVIENLTCKNLMVDYNAQKNQVLRFNRFEYERGSKNILHLRAEVLESLNPVRKIEVDVPVSGTILVTETVLEEPMVEVKKIPTPTPTPKPTPKPKTTPQDPMGENYDEQNPQNYQEGQQPQQGPTPLQQHQNRDQGIRQPPQQQQGQGSQGQEQQQRGSSEEGGFESNDLQQVPQQQQQIPQQGPAEGYPEGQQPQQQQQQPPQPNSR